MQQYSHLSQCLKSKTGYQSMIHLGLNGICHRIPSLLHVTKACYLGLSPCSTALHITHTLSLHSHPSLNPYQKTLKGSAPK